MTNEKRKGSMSFLRNLSSRKRGAGIQKKELKTQPRLAELGGVTNEK